jgi:hypothetical protein
MLEAEGEKTQALKSCSAIKKNSKYIRILRYHSHRLCGLVVRVLGYRSRGPGSIPGVTRFSEK